MKPLLPHKIQALAVLLLGCFGLFAQVAPPGIPLDPPTLQIVTPTNGTTVTVGAPIPILIRLSTNHFPTGIGPVTVFSGNQFIGIADPLPQIAIFPPPAPSFLLVWSGASEGTHTLVASVITAGLPEVLHGLLVSAPITLQVVSATPPPTNPVPVVTVRALEMEIAEGSGVRNAFEVRRSGSLDRPLEVGFNLSGTATFGVDYAIPFGLQTVTFERGDDSAKVTLRPAGDTRIEGIETVVLELRPSGVLVVNGGTPPYYLGEPSRAETRIVDFVPAPDPTLAWQAPAPGTAFALGQTVSLRVQAIDPQGYLPDMEFLVSDANGRNTRLLGSSGIRFLVAPTNGTPIVHELEWISTNGFAGANRIVARAVRANGTTVESPILELRGERAPETPVVALRVEQDEASEANPGMQFVFRIERSGPATLPLTVRIASEGTAVRGRTEGLQTEIDYWLELNPCALCARPIQWVQGDEITLPAGVSSIRIGGSALDDTLSEGVETVLVRLLPGTLSSTDVPAYRVDPAHSLAEAILHDNDMVPELPVVTVVARDASGSETNANDTITFEARRAGPAQEALWVHYVLLGTAQHRLDYLRTSDANVTDPTLALPAPLAIEIPAGKTNGTVEFTVLSDTRREGDETLVLNLIQPVPAPNVRLRRTYEIGRPDAARAVIHDVPAVEEPPAVVSVTATVGQAVEPGVRVPGTNGVFTLARTGSTHRAITVNYSIAGTARNGRDYEYLDGDATLAAGISHREIRVVSLRDRSSEGPETVMLTLRSGRGYIPGDSTQATVVISDASSPTNAEPSLVITHPLDEARFQGPSHIRIEVTAIDPAADIRRVEFLANGRSLGVSEHWTRDAVIPGAPRHHLLDWTNPPAGRFRLQARAEVGGRSVESDGVDISVTAPPAPPVVIHHPADIATQDRILTAEEEGAYARHWRMGLAWTNPVGRIPASYVARAGFLLQHGGAYSYQPRQGPAALYWVPEAGTNGSTAIGWSKSRESEAKDESLAPFSLIADTTLLSGWFDTSVSVDSESEPSVAWPSGVPDRVPLSFAILEVPNAGATTNPATVTLRSLPATGVLSHVIELSIGTGNTATHISDDGVLDESAGIIRWGPFHDDANRRITATLGKTSLRNLGGIASFDGYDTRIRIATAASSGRGPRIGSIESRNDGSIQLLVVDDSGALNTGGRAIEASSDLIHWRRIQQTSAGEDSSALLDSDAVEESVRYYRVVTE